MDTWVEILLNVGPWLPVVQFACLIWVNKVYHHVFHEGQKFSGRSLAPLIGFYRWIIHMNFFQQHLYLAWWQSIAFSECGPTYLSQWLCSPLCPWWGIRASTITFHQTLFIAIFSASPHVFPMLSSSLITVRRQDCFGLPCFLFPWGFHFMAILVVFFFSFLKVWPIHFHFLRFIVIASSSCPVLTHRSLFVMTFGQKIPSIWRSLSLTNICTLESRVLVSCQVLDPSGGMNLTFLSTAPKL